MGLSIRLLLTGLLLIKPSILKLWKDLRLRVRDPCGRITGQLTLPIEVTIKLNMGLDSGHMDTTLDLN